MYHKIAQEQPRLSPLMYDMESYVLSENIKLIEIAKILQKFCMVKTNGISDLILNAGIFESEQHYWPLLRPTWVVV